MIQHWDDYQGSEGEGRQSPHIVDEPRHRHAPTGKLMVNLLGSIAERELMLERQREGIAKAKWEVSGTSAHGAPEGKGRAETEGRGQVRA